LPTVDANGITINYHVEGAGPPLIMLHGATSAPLEDWAAQRPAFRQAFRLFLPDARGHAGTRWDARDGFSNEMLVADLLGFADALGLDTFHLVGFSMGAMTSLMFAARHPERLRTAIICGIDTFREPRASVARRLMDPERILREEPAWAKELARRHDPVQGPGAWQRLLPAIAADVAIQPLPTPAELRNIRLPVLLVYGDRDVFVPPDHAVAIYRQLPDARLLMAPNCPHQVMVYQPALFNQAAASYYRSTEPVARQRAERGATVGSGAAAYNPVASHAGEPASEDEGADPFSNW
jgi:pimeloyl-ACP methyl ester carboxylesterase